jgi:gluconolactonase
VKARCLACAALVASLGSVTTVSAAPRSLLQSVTDEKPDAIVDLKTAEGSRLVKGQWRAAEARIVEVDARGPGVDLRASGKLVRAKDLALRAGAADFDDSAWEPIDLSASPGLEQRRSTGKLAFEWYRIKVTIPEKIGGLDPTGSTVVFEIVVDDYAEIWVDGKLPRVLGQSGGPLVQGFNAPNRVILTHDARPGRQFQLAILGANGPLSDPPANFIWVRSATLDVYRPGRFADARAWVGDIERLDPALDGIIAAGTRIEKLADGFQFIEGPVWHPDGYLLFSDPNNNRIYRWTQEGDLSIYRTKSGYTGADIGEYGQPGSNGLALDGAGRLTIDEHGNRRVTRLEKTGALTVLADRFEGKRLNSPNDLVYRSDGALYFTDPPFGLPKFFEDPRKELPYSGVFCLIDGRLKLVSRDLAGPNGLAFSPGEKYLYVDNWDVKKKVVMRYEVQADGSLAKGQVFFDMTGAPGDEALDGLKVDQKGNLYVSGPGGLWILSPEGVHLGTLKGPELAANFAWGDADGRTLYMTARTGLYRIRLEVPGIRPAPVEPHP